ncbi:MAG: hypothetical protein NTU80_09005 [Verrucomicrobia bacterium]|nr:hypothetical protein [Verrucomicrobiota bacterium]
MHAITHNLLTFLLQRLSDDHDLTEKKLVAVHDKPAAKRTKEAIAGHPFF